MEDVDLPTYSPILNSSVLVQLSLPLQTSKILSFGTGTYPQYLREMRPLPSLKRNTTQRESASQVLTPTKFKGTLKRQRARAACVTCHQRKVRCDGSIVGTPCTNCRLDTLDCCMRPRGSVYPTYNPILSSPPLF